MEPIKILDKGFVRFVSMMDGDSGVTEAARVSYLSEAKTEEEDRKLIAYLMKHRHTTPFEAAVFKFHIKCPLFIARQLFRHRMASYNETSFRYRVAPEEFYFPAAWRVQDTKNKQGSLSGNLNHDVETAILERACASAMESYRTMLAHGVAKEMARMVLPVNLYTEYYWTVNAHAVMHFIRLRSDSHAQFEARQVSHAVARVFSEKMPWTWAAFSDGLHEGYEELREYLGTAAAK